MDVWMQFVGKIQTKVQKTERLQVKNIICPIFIAALIKLSKRNGNTIKFFKSDSCVYILHFDHRFAVGRLKS